MGWAITFFILAGLNALCVIVNAIKGEWDWFFTNLTVASLFASVGLYNYKDAKPQTVHYKDVVNVRIDTVTTIHQNDTIKTYNVLIEDGMIDR